MERIIVGVDVGTKTGLVTFGLDGRLINRKTLQCDVGYQAQNLYRTLTGFLTPGMIVAWEEPFGKYGQSVLQRMVGGMLAACEQIGCNNIPVHLVHNKKYATGNARATKQDMIAAAIVKWGASPAWDEHQADAAWVGQFAMDQVLEHPQINKGGST